MLKKYKYNFSVYQRHLTIPTQMKQMILLTVIGIYARILYDQSKILLLYVYMYFRFTKHSNEEVKVLLACCIANVFPIFSPKLPCADLDELLVCLVFFVTYFLGCLYILN